MTSLNKGSGREPLRVGQRVMVRDIGRKHKGTIRSIGNTYVTVTADEDGACRPYYPEQLRRLRKKPRKEERVECWEKNKLLGEILEATEKRVQIVYQGQGTDRAVAMWGAAMALEFASPFIRESKPGEVLLDREKLEKIWDEHLWMPQNLKPKFLHKAKDSESFDRFCTALGAGAGKGNP